MNILDSILKKWNENKDVETLISEGLFSDETAIQLSLDQLSDEDKQKVMSQLNEIESAIQDYINGIDREKKEIKQQLDANLKSAKACLSYGSSIDIQKRGKE